MKSLAHTHEISFKSLFSIKQEETLPNTTEHFRTQLQKNTTLSALVIGSLFNASWQERKKEKKTSIWLKDKITKFYGNL